jgi:aspartate racemase
LLELIKAAQSLDMQRQRVIGLIGGISWESSVEYYRITKRRGSASKRRRSFSAAPDVVSGFCRGRTPYRRGEWGKLTEQMKDAAIRLEHGGADFVFRLV